MTGLGFLGGAVVAAVSLAVVGEGEGNGILSWLAGPSPPSDTRRVSRIAIATTATAKRHRSVAVALETVTEPLTCLILHVKATPADAPAILH